MNNELKSRVSVGMKVRTSDGKLVGHVSTVHGDTFEIERGVFFNRDYAASFDEVARIDHAEVILSLSAETLAAMRTSGGVGTSFGDRAAGAVSHARAAIDEALHASRHPSK